MAEHNADIIIFGAGIAGLWLLGSLKRSGYNVLLLEKNTVGGGQSIASQGIIHSGLKYTIAGKVNDLARSISAMPDIWRGALDGSGDIDLSAAGNVMRSQYMLIPSGVVGETIKLVSKKALGLNAGELSKNDWPAEIKSTGFAGSVIHMNEPVLDIPRVIDALCAAYEDCIRKIDDDTNPFDFLERHNIKAQRYIFTAAGQNEFIARQRGDHEGLKTQSRPLLMGLMKNAPCPLYAHLIGTSEKPVATITTHFMPDGALVWYIGGGVAERAENADPNALFKDIKAAFKRYLPFVDLSAAEWASFPISRSEGFSGNKGWMPDTPTIHAAENRLYCWPTKLTFAPMLSNMVSGYLKDEDVKSSNAKTDWSFLPAAERSLPPWYTAKWKRHDD